MKTWIITNTHFFPDKLVDCCDRPADFAKQIVRNWCNNVASDDLIYHLGDVGFYKKQKCGGLIRTLPGHKVLILGNHDRFPTAWYRDKGFMAVMDYVIVTALHVEGIKKPRNFYYKVLLSHIPMSIPDGVDWNIHGHFHNNSSLHWEENIVKILTPKHRLYSLEEMNYMPILLGEALYQDRLVHTLERAKEIRNE